MYSASNVFTATTGGSFSDGVTHTYADAATANGKVANVQYQLLIDLTALFGAGNEPTVAQMDALMAQFPNSWFDGTKNIAENDMLMQQLLRCLRR